MKWQILLVDLSVLRGPRLPRFEAIWKSLINDTKWVLLPFHRKLIVCKQLIELITLRAPNLRMIESHFNSIVRQEYYYLVVIVPGIWVYDSEMVQLYLVPLHPLWKRSPIVGYVVFFQTAKCLLTVAIAPDAYLGFHGVSSRGPWPFIMERVRWIRPP